MLIADNCGLPKYFVEEIDSVYSTLHSVNKIKSWKRKLYQKKPAILHGNENFLAIERHIFELKVLNHIHQHNPCAKITYEPPGKNPHGKKCDILVESDVSYLVELKSFNPDHKKKPIQYQHIAERNELCMDENYYHDRQAVQGHLIDQVIYTENKLENYKDGHVTVLGVRIGFDLHIESLRDFITIYRTGKPRGDDGFGKMTVYNLQNKAKFKGTIMEFWGFPFERFSFSLEHGKNALSVSLIQSMDKEVNII